MLSKVFTSATLGIDAYLVEVEIDISKGLPYFATVGLPDNAVKESKDRVRAAIKNSGYEFPARRITVNLAPAHIKKEGTTFDLPVAIGILIAEGVLQEEAVRDFIILGELSLDGSIKATRGVLSVAVLARSLGKKLLVPTANGSEAAIVEGVGVYGIESLAEAVEFLNNGRTIEPVAVVRAEAVQRERQTDLSEVKGQAHVKRALEVAAAGSHNMLMIGPPGSGKTMLAMRLPGILPDMTLDEAIETTKVHSVAGLLEGGAALVVERPFRAPHHTISDAGLIGGGKVPRPGEVSLAHNGVLFLDELPEFRRNVLEVMRQPLEDGSVSISRALVSLSYPSEFMLVAAMNPCPCGFLGDSQKECVCTPLQVRQYRGRISGPLLDRIDIHCEVPAVRYRDMTDDNKGEASVTVKARVDAARRTQAERFKGEAASNGRMSTRLVKRHCELSKDSSRLLETAVERLGLSARAYTRILKVARTIADLEGENRIEASHISEAIQYRTFDREI